jgi:tetratricopeptide (TPR) repeat protein
MFQLTDFKASGSSPPRSSASSAVESPSFHQRWARQEGWKWALALLLLLATLLAFLPAIRGGYIWDDDAFVTDNLILRGGWNALARLWFQFGATQQYYPLTYSTFWIEYHIWGLTPRYSHIVNVLLHALNALLIWRVLSRLRVPGAPLAAIIFALHPVEVESVAWITERKNVLSTTFYLATVMAFLRFEPRLTSLTLEKEEPRQWRFYPLVVFLFLCALWSKTVACTLPAAMAVLLSWKLQRVRWRDLLPLTPLLVIGAGMGLLTAWMEKHVIGAKGNDWSLTTPDRFLIAGRAIWFYLSKLAWPANLTFIYPRWDLNPGEWWQWLFPAAVVGGTALLWMARGVIGKAPLAAAAFFAITLFPALGFVDVYPFRYSFVADHFQYLASVGPIALGSAGIVTASRRFKRSFPYIEPAIGAALIITLGLLTWQQSRMYSSLETLYRTTIRRNPGCWMAHDNLAFLLLNKGKVRESIDQSRKSLEFKRDDAAAHVNLANALLAEGRLDDAIDQYESAIHFKPDLAEAQSDLGNALMMKGRLDEAIGHYERAIELNPNYAAAENNLGYALMQKGQLDQAIAHFQKAIALKPDYNQAQENLVIATARKR